MMERTVRAVVALLLVPAVSMCGKAPEIRQPTPPPVAPVAADPTPVVIPDTSLSVDVRRAQSLVAEGDARLGEGAYDLAIVSYRRVMALDRVNDPDFPRELRAQALWGEALANLSVNPSGDTVPTMTLLQTLVSSYDGTVEATQAKVVIAMLTRLDRLRGQSAQKDEDIKSLKETLEQLKRIDLSRRPGG